MKDKVKWLTENGFTADGITYCLISGDTYPIKEKLKENGFKFNTSLKWHGAEPLSLGADFQYLALSVDDYFIWNEDLGAYFITEAGRRFLDAETFAHSIFHESHFLGCIGEKLTQDMIYDCTHPFSTRYYGQQYIHQFIANNKDCVIWITASALPNFTKNARVFVSGTVKDHKVYNSIPTTYITRAQVSIMKEG